MKNKQWAYFNSDSEFNIPDINERIQILNNQSYIRSLFYGNINEINVEQFVKKNIQSKLDLNSKYFLNEHELFNENEAIPFFTEIKDYPNYIIFRLKSTKSHGRAFVGNYFYLGSRFNYRENILIELLYLALLNDCLPELEKLGYTNIFRFGYILNNNTYFVIFAGEIQDPKQINKDLDNIFTKIEHKLYNLDEEEELYKLKLNLLTQLTKKEKNLSERSNQVFQTISLNSE